MRAVPDDEPWDEKVVKQIEAGIPLVASFLDLANLIASRHAAGALDAALNRCGSLFLLLEGQHSDAMFDGFMVLLYGMLVGLVAILLRSQQFDLLARFFTFLFFIPRRGNSEAQHVRFTHLPMYVRSLDVDRNSRLGKNAVSLTADLLKEQFSKGALSSYFSFDEFMGADYLLYLRSALELRNQLDQIRWKAWIPQTTVYLQQPPEFLERAESRAYFSQLKTALGETGSDIDSIRNSWETVGRKYSEFVGPQFYRVPPQLSIGPSWRQCSNPQIDALSALP